MVNKFDPIFILFQMVAMQCLYYLAMGTMWGLCHALYGTPASLDHFFTPNYINFDTVAGWIEILCTLLTSILGSFLLSHIIEKTKKCVDFTLTMFIIHIMICLYYQPYVFVWEWWLLQVISSVTMATLGEYLCARNELQDIPLYSNESN